jgi:hypothetical protein
VDAGTRPVIVVTAIGSDGPVAGARVMVESSPAPMPDLAGLTGEDGEFTLGTVGPGRYVIVVYADGYVPARSEAVVRVDEKSVGTRVRLRRDE